MVRIFKDLEFARAAKKARIPDVALREAAVEADQGLVDAYLGGECIKKRIPRVGGGKRDGFRTILAFRRGERAIFIHIFAKNSIENVSKADLADLKIYAETLLGLTERGLEIAVGSGALIEI